MKRMKTEKVRDQIIFSIFGDKSLVSWGWRGKFQSIQKMTNIEYLKLGFL